MAAVVVQAAHNKIDPKYLIPPPKNEEQKMGLFKRIVKNVTGTKEEKFEDPFADFDERTMIDMTDTDAIALNIGVLYVIDNDRRVLQIPITKDSFVLGRNRAEVDFCFDGENDRGVSRVHAIIIQNDDGYFVTDKNSSGGTFVNDEMLSPDIPTQIKSGDKLRLYKKELLFECSES
jgi:pSer/pThr/pTyr-binding forkhead associated (FHA) protein